MYLPPSFRQDDLAELHALIAATRLATLVTVADGVPLVSHVPMLLDPARGERGTLQCHLAVANPQARALERGAPALAIFLGPNAYVTPSWYESKREHGKVVPTWNYLAAHASGPLEPVTEPRALHALVDALTRHYEEPRAEPWAIGDAPAPYIDGQLRGIVGIEIAIERLEGKWKLGQNRSESDVAGVADGLERSSDPLDREIADAMRRAKFGSGA